MSPMSWFGLRPCSCLPALSCALALALAPAGEPFLDIGYEEALSRSKDEGKLLVVDFTASWCPPCKKMEKDTWPAESVRTWLAERALTIQVDVDEQQELSQSLKIAAMPTMVVFKDGAEFDRIVGYKDPAGLLAWLDAVVAGKRSVDAVLEKATALEGSDDVDARHELARELLQQGEHERALKEYMWLWPNTREAKGYGGVRLSYLLSEIARLCEAYEPAREAFTKILDELDTKIRKGSAEYGYWSEWFRMSQYLEDSQRVLAYHATHRDAEGRLDVPGRNAFLGNYITGEFFDVLMQHEQFVDAARLVPDLEAKARDVVTDARRFRELHQKMFADNQEMLASMKDHDYTSLQENLGRLHAAALAVDRRDQARAIGDMLLAEYDDAESRLALVELALVTGRAGAEHRKWLDEAEQRGANVEALRMKLPPAEGGVTEPVAEPAAEPSDNRR